MAQTQEKTRHTKIGLEAEADRRSECKWMGNVALPRGLSPCFSFRSFDLFLCFLLLFILFSRSVCFVCYLSFIKSVCRACRTQYDDMYVCSVYPSTSSTTSVCADSSILEEIPGTNEVHVMRSHMWSQSYVTDILRCRVPGVQ